MPASVADVEGRLWDIADSLRANSGLRASEYPTPVLGLIFLRFADHRFADRQKRQRARAHVQFTIETVLNDRLPRAYTPDDYRQRCAIVYEHVYDSYSGLGGGYSPGL